MSFSYKSRRSRDGFAFQNKLLEEIKSAGFDASDVRTFFTEKGKSIGRNFTTTELCNFEHRFGDIRILVGDKEVWLECVTINQEKSIFPERKIRKFKGNNRWYAFRVMDDHDTIYFLPSRSWNSYAKKMENLAVHGKPFRKLFPKNILSFRKKIIGLQNFLATHCKPCED